MALPAVFSRNGRGIWEGSEVVSATIPASGDTRGRGDRLRLGAVLESPWPLRATNPAPAVIAKKGEH